MSDFPVVAPTLNLDFANSRQLDPRITFRRSSTGTYVDADGLIKTANIDQPRFDHYPATGQSLGLLVEEQRTNVALHSEQFDNAAWSKSASSVTANTSTAPDGATTADKLVNDSSTGEHSISGSNVLFGGLATGATFSCYAKAAELTRIAIGYPFTYAVFDLSAGVVSSTTNAYSWTFSSSIQKLSNGWYRCSVFVNTNGTAFNTQSRIWTANSSNSVSYAGDGISGVYLWGAQLEAGSFPTSYIPTAGSTVTRTADVANITGTNFSSWYNQNGGTLFTSARFPAIGTRGLAQIFPTSPGSSTSVIGNLVVNGVDHRLRVVINSLGQAELQSGGAYTSGSLSRIASRFAANDFAVVANGQAAAVDTSGSIPVSDQLQLGRDFVSGYLNGTLSRLTYWPLRLPNSQLIALTKR
jgi:hypothetical protein